MSTTTLSNAQLKRLRKQALEKEILRASKQHNAFRTEELYWKDRVGEPDWSSAFNVNDSKNIKWDDENTSSVIHGIWTDRLGKEWRIRKFYMEDEGEKVGLLFDDMPGLVLLPSYVDMPEQHRLIRACLHETTTPKSRSNLDTHYVVPPNGWWNTYTHDPDCIIQPRYDKLQPSVETQHAKNEKRIQVDLPEMNEKTFLRDVEKKDTKADPVPSDSVKPTPLKDLIRKLRWTIIGLEYHWGTKSYKWDKPAMPMPDLIKDVCSRCISHIPWSSVFPDSSIVDYSSWAQDYKAEAGVVNFYQYRDSLTAHVDQSEVDTVRPLVSISLGESAIFLAGGKTREEVPVSLILKSGDAVIMSGQSRRIFHGVPRIVEGQLDSRLLQGWDDAEDAKQIKDFLVGTRININVRQVFS